MSAGNNEGAALAAPTPGERAAAPISNFEATAPMLDASISKFEDRASFRPIAKLGGDTSLATQEVGGFQNPAKIAGSCQKADCRTPAPETRPARQIGIQTITPATSTGADARPPFQFRTTTPPENHMKPSDGILALLDEASDKAFAASISDMTPTNLRRLRAAIDTALPPENHVTGWALTDARGRVSNFTDSATDAQVWKELGYIVREYVEAPAPQTKSVLGSIVGPEALTPCAEPLGENISEIGASEGRKTSDSGLTALFDNLGSARVAKDTGIAFHNGLRTEARAQASPSRREIGDTDKVERQLGIAMVVPSQTNMGALREAYDRLHGQGAQDLSSFIRDFEGTIVDDATCDHQLANYLARGAYGFFVGKFVGEELGAVVVLLEDTVRADVEVEPGHGSSLRLPAHNLAERILFLAGQKSSPQTRESGRPATNGSQPPCATIEGVADGDDLIKDRTLRGHCGDLPPQTHTRGDLTPQMLRDTAGWEQIEEELRHELRLAANALEGCEAELESRTRELDEIRAGVKRLSDEEELCAETTGDDPFSMVYLAAKLAAAGEARAEQWRLRRDAEGSRDAAKAFADSLVSERDEFRAAIEWCVERDQRNGSLPEAYAERLRAALATTEGQP